MDGLEAFEDPSALEEAAGLDAEEDASEDGLDLASELAEGLLPDSLLRAFFRSSEG